MRRTIIPYLHLNQYSHVYEFGVYNGDSIVSIYNIFDSVHRPIDKFFAFDSFDGFPETDENYQDTWHTGGLSSKEHFGVSSIEECIQKILDKTGYRDSLELIPGFFSDTLTQDIAQTYNMGPASFINLDADLYSSAIEVLEFVVVNNILKEGTLIWYDDWGGSPNWMTYNDGESRAHREICDKYNIKCKQLVEIGDGYPHMQRLYVIEKIK